MSQFPIETFIEHRWAEAKEELAYNVPEFVVAMQAAHSLLQRGFVFPEGLPSPQWRLTAV